MPAYRIVVSADTSYENLARSIRFIPPRTTSIIIDIAGYPISIPKEILHKLLATIPTSVDLIHCIVRCYMINLSYRAYTGIRVISNLHGAPEPGIFTHYDGDVNRYRRPGTNQYYDPVTEEYYIEDYRIFLYELAENKHSECVTYINQFLSGLCNESRTLSIDISATFNYFAADSRHGLPNIQFISPDAYLEYIICGLMTVPYINYVKVGHEFYNFSWDKIREFFNSLARLGVSSLDFSDPGNAELPGIPFSIFQYLPPAITEVTFNRKELVKMKNIIPIAEDMPYVIAVNIVDAVFSPYTSPIFNSYAPPILLNEKEMHSFELLGDHIGKKNLRAQLSQLHDMLTSLNLPVSLIMDYMAESLSKMCYARPIIMPAVSRLTSENYPYERSMGIISSAINYSSAFFSKPKVVSKDVLLANAEASDYSVIP